MVKKPKIKDIFDAAGVGDVDALKRFLASGVNPNLRDNINLTPIHLASYAGHLPIVVALIEAGAEVNVSNKIGFGPLMVAAQEGWLEVVQLLIEKGADVNAKTIEGQTAVLMASSTVPIIESDVVPQADILRILINAGADVNVVDVYGGTPLMSASFGGSLDKVQLLVENGANPLSIDLKGKSALSDAISKGHTAVASYLEGVIVNQSS